MHTLLKTLSRRLSWGTRHGVGRAPLAARFRPGLENLERRDLMASIPGLFNTGVDNSDNLLPTDAKAQPQVDPHYSVTFQATPGGNPAPPAVAYAVLQNGYPIGSPWWTPNLSDSQWIAPHANENSLPGQGGVSEPAGYFTYETTFNLTGLDPATAAITGQYSDDDRMVKVLLNGSAVGVSLPPTDARGADFYTMHTFTISNTANFQPGINRLDFVVQNASPLGQQNPSGLQVEFTSALADPLPTITVTDAKTTDSQNLTVKYNVTGDDGSKPIVLDVYRSNSANVTAAKAPGQVLVAELTLQNNDATTGKHTIVIGPNGTSQFLASAGNALRPDPNHSYVDVVADVNGKFNPADANAPPQANFRIWLIGAVTHGYTNKKYLKGLVGPTPPQK
jgi:hypothetical protein